MNTEINTVCKNTAEEEILTQKVLTYKSDRQTFKGNWMQLYMNMDLSHHTPSEKPAVSFLWQSEDCSDRVLCHHGQEKNNNALKVSWKIKGIHKLLKAVIVIMQHR